MIETKVVIEIPDTQYKRIREWAFDIDITSYLRDKLNLLDPDTYEGSGVVIGVPLHCARCGYSWIYKGKEDRVKCGRCGKHIRTHAWERRHMENGNDAHRV